MNGQRRMTVCVAISLAALATAAQARDALGVFEAWGAFRDPATPRCYAIAEPDRASSGGFYATVSYWPRDRVRSQIFVRFPRAVTRATLSVGGRQFPLVVRERGGWTADTRSDAMIVAAMRSAPRMEAIGRDADGTRMVGNWRLRGAATAIDAAALGCAGR